MGLEDHLGDILAKARAMSGVSRAAAARAAGLSEAELADLEATGRASKRPNYDPLAALVGLDAAKLETIAAGWVPEPVDVSRWRQLRVLTGDEGGMAVNSFLVWDESSREAALFDTGWSAVAAFELIQAHALVLRHLCITHGHRDHMAAVESVLARFPGARMHRGAATDKVGTDAANGRALSVGCLRVKALATPGHAPDGVTYVVSGWPGGAPAVAFVGDALFAGSMGRGNQSWSLARQAARECILSLPPETLICPGHGPLTTVAQERAHNPFF